MRLNNRADTDSVGAQDNTAPHLKDASRKDELCEALFAYIEEAGERELDTAVVDDYLAQLEEIAPAAPYDQAAEMERLQRQLARKSTHTIPPIKRRRRLRMAGIVIAAVLFLMVTTIVVLGDNPLNKLVSAARDVFVSTSQSGRLELQDVDAGEYRSMEEALSMNDMTDADCLNWIPNDFSIIGVEVRASDKSTRCAATYWADRGEMRVQVSKNTDKHSYFEEMSDHKGYVYQNNGSEYEIFQNTDSAKASWEDDKYAYEISGQVTVEELEKMIGSIK